jgi:hypothetical protein
MSPQPNPAHRREGFPFGWLRILTPGYSLRDDVVLAAAAEPPPAILKILSQYKAKSCRNTRLELSSCCAPDQRKVGPPFASQGRSRTPAIFNGIVPFNFPLGPVQIGCLKKRASGSRNAASPPKRKSNVSAPSPTNTATTNRPSRTRVTVVGQSASRGRLGCF